MRPAVVPRTAGPSSTSCRWRCVGRCGCDRPAGRGTTWPRALGAAAGVFVESSSLRTDLRGRRPRWRYRKTSSTVEVRTMMGWYGSGMGLGAWLFMGTFWVLLLALIVWLVVRLLPSGNRPAAGAAPQSPEEILDARFARGEIDEQAYAAARTALSAARGQGR